MPELQRNHVPEVLAAELAMDIERLRRMTGETMRVAPIDETAEADLTGVDETTLAELDALRTNVRDLVANEQTSLGRWRAVSTRTRLAAVLGLALTGPALLAWGAPRTNLATTAPLRLAATLAVVCVSLAAIVTDALRPLHRRAPSDALRSSLIALAFGIPLVVALLPHGDPGLYAGVGAAFFEKSGLCLGVGALSSLPILLLALVSMRHRGHGHMRPMLGAATAGLVGNAALVLHCPILTAPHQLIGHVTLVPLLIAGVIVWHSACNRAHRDATPERR